MRLLIQLPGFSKTRIEFYRNWFTGRVRIEVHGETALLASPWDMSTHFSLHLTTEYNITMGEPEPHHVVISRTRPLLLAGIRPHRYRVYVDDILVQDETGY